MQDSGNAKKLKHAHPHLTPEMLDSRDVARRFISVRMDFSRADRIAIRFGALTTGLRAIRDTADRAAETMRVA
jgi:hypothetical protein